MLLSLFTLIIFTGWAAIAGNYDADSSAIIRTASPNGWLLRTRSSVYQIVITTSGDVRPVYYGPAVQAVFRRKNAEWSGTTNEVPVRGGYPFNTPALEAVFPDGVRDVDLEYVKGEIMTMDGRPALKITQQDRHYPLEVISYIRVLQEFDMLEKWIVVKNTGRKGNIKIENLLSGSIVLPSDEYILTQLAGKPVNEFQLYESGLSPGLKIIQNKTFKSNFNPPWFAVRPQHSDGETGPVWFGALHYSGNWQIAFDKAFAGRLQILGGINFWDTDLNLKPGDSFETPKLSVGFTERGLDGAAQDEAAYIRKTILPAAHRNDLRPVLFNGYYVTGLDVNETRQEELAEIAAQMGVELFVMDDGWFKGRSDSNTGLGEWIVDSVKFPHGLTPLIRKVNDLGMKFGIWAEPENVDVNSDLYRAHPDWVLHFPNREGNPKRRVLNLARPEVYNYLLGSLSKLLSENNIGYVKWDQNNFLSDPGWPDAPPGEQREVRIRYISNLYRLVDELKKRFPKVWFESCSSGGGRVDLGMMSRMDQAWVSDNTIALNRLFIQYGYLSAMPANTMASWVVSRDSYLYAQPTSLDYKFNVAMSGVLGIGDDISKWTDSERVLAKSRIAVYKQIRPLVQQGTLYRLVSPFKANREALQYVSEDSTAAVLLCYNMAEYLQGSQLITRGSDVLRLKGLGPGEKYRLQIAGDPNDSGSVYSGDFLMQVGIAWPVAGAYNSKIIRIKQVR